MLCTVCHGSGISPGSERIGGLECGACNGSGRLPDRSAVEDGWQDEVPDRESDPDDRISASERKQAFNRHLREINSMFPGRSYALHMPWDDRTTETEPLGEVDLMHRMIRLDSRMTPMLMRVMPGNCDESVIDELEDLRRGYQDLLRRRPRSASLVPKHQLQTAIARCSWYCGAAAESLRADSRALEYYRQAQQEFLEAGSDDEVQRARQKILEIQNVLEDNPDQRLAELQSSLLEQDPGSPQRAETLISLGYACLKAGDSFAARNHFDEARVLLDASGNPDPGALATGLLETMQSILNPGESKDAGVPIVNLLKQRSLYQQLYNGLSQAWRDADPLKSEQYNRMAQDMDSRESSQDFGNQALSLWQGRFRDQLK